MTAARTVGVAFHKIPTIPVAIVSAMRGVRVPGFNDDYLRVAMVMRHTTGEIERRDREQGQTRTESFNFTD